MSAPYNNSKGDLTQGPIARHLTRLAVPMTWGILTIISFQLVNTFYIGFLGTEKLAAISFTFPVTYGMFSVVIGFGIAMSSVLSRLIGENKMDDVRRVTTQGLLIAFLFCVLMSAVGYIFSDRLFVVLGADETMRPLIHDYMTPWFIGAVFISLPIVGNAAIRATGDTMTAAVIMTVAALVNVILDPILIFGLLGFPRLELQGAAISTIIANAAAMIAGLYVIHARKKLTDLRYLISFEKFGDSAKRILMIALPAGLTNAIQPVVNAYIVSLLALSGPAAVASFGIVTRVEAFAFIILMGVAVGMAPIIGQNVGAKKFDRVRETLKLAMNFNIAWSAFIAVILGLLAKPIAGIFSNDPDVIRYAALFFWIVPFSYILSNIVNGWASAFNAMGQPQKSFIMIVVKMIVLLVPAVYAGHHVGGITGIFIAIAAVNVLAGGVFHLWSWKTIKSAL